ncbi:unnamed protein product, partial [Effrenium voratum]
GVTTNAKLQRYLRAVRSQRSEQAKRPEQPEQAERSEHVVRHAGATLEKKLQILTRLSRLHARVPPEQVCATVAAVPGTRKRRRVRRMLQSLDQGQGAAPPSCQSATLRDCKTFAGLAALRE